MKRILPVVAALVLGTGCQQLFTTSLASSLARPPVTPSSLDAEGAAEYLAVLQSNPQPAVAQAALPALADLVASNPSPAVLSDAAAIAVVATGLDQAFTQTLASIDIATLASGGTLSSTDLDTIATALEGVAVSAQTTQIFETLASSSAADPSALAAQGVDATILVVAAASLAIADIQNNPAISLQGVLDGTDTYSPDPGLQATLDDLANAAAAIDPNSQFADLLQGFFGI